MSAAEPLRAQNVTTTILKSILSRAGANQGDELFSARLQLSEPDILLRRMKTVI